MPNNCECLKKLSFCCPCKLNVIGYITGWLGIVWRAVLVAFLSSIIAKITEYDPSIYSIFFISCLVYFLTSFVINVIFLYGIFKERRHFMLPYITIVALEMVIAAILASGVVMLLFAINSIIFAIYVLIIALIIIGVHFTLWLYSILIYKDLEFEAIIKRGSRQSISITRINSLNDI